MSMSFLVARLTILSALARGTQGFLSLSSRAQHLPPAFSVGTTFNSHFRHNSVAQHKQMISSSSSSSKNSRRFMSSGTGEGVELKHIGKTEMEEILEDLENGGREESGYIVMDVRGEEEVAYTGKLSEGVLTLPLPVIMQLNVFSMDPEEFEEVCGFPKPEYDETLVFTCAAGIRSVQAAKFAAMNGYTNIVNYMGGANEWFYP